MASKRSYVFAAKSWVLVLIPQLQNVSPWQLYLFSIPIKSIRSRVYTSPRSFRFNSTMKSGITMNALRSTMHSCTAALHRGIDDKELIVKGFPTNRKRDTYLVFDWSLVTALRPLSFVWLTDSYFPHLGSIPMRYKQPQTDFLILIPAYYHLKSFNVFLRFIRAISLLN